MVNDCVLGDEPSLLVSWLLDDGQSDAHLARLDQLVKKELHAGHFSRVVLVLKALESLSENQRQTVASLGLAAKMVLWFKMVCDSLTSDLHRRSALLFSLTDGFLDYFMLLSQASLPVPELSAVLLQLIHLSLNEEIHFPLRLEGIRTFNYIIESLSREQRRLIQTEQGQNPIMLQVAEAVLKVGDYELQGSLSEALCRLTPRRYRQERAKQWFSSPDIGNAFCDMRDGDFEVDCRHFLNFVNASHGEQRRVYTFPCLRAFLNSSELFRPKDDKLEEFWVDFNVESGNVSFFIDEAEATLWGSIHLLKDDVKYYTLHVRDEEVVFCVQLNNPIIHEGSRGHMVELTFSCEHRGELQKAAERVFMKPASSPEKMGVVVPASPSVKTKCGLTYSRKKPKSKTRLKVLPLSSPSSEEDSSVSMMDRRSQAEILFDTVIRQSTPITSRVVDGEEPHSAQQQTADFGGNISPIKKDVIRKRKAADSAYLSEQTESSPATKKAADPEQEEEEEAPLIIVTESSSEGAEEALANKEERPLPEPQSELTPGILIAFKTLQSELEKQFAEKRKKVEAGVNFTLMEYQQHVSSLLTAVHEHRMKSLQTFGSSVSDHLKQLAEQLLTLNSMNTQILEFFQLEKQRLETFCDDLLQSFRLKSVDGGELKAASPSSQSANLM